MLSGTPPWRERACLKFGAKGTAHEWTTLDPLEAHLVADAAEFSELLRRVKALDGEMAFARLQVLTDGQDVHLYRAQITHYLDHFFGRLAQPDHDAGFRDCIGLNRLCVAERCQGHS